MDIFTANHVVFVMFIFTLGAIIYLMGTIFGVAILETVLDKMKNNSGNYSGTKILMFVGFIALLYLLWLWLAKTKNTVRASLTRTQDETTS